MAKKLDVCKSTQDSGIAAGQRRRAAVQCFLTALVLCLASAAGAGGVALTNVNLLGDRPEAMFLQCDIAWSNSWRSPADELGNWDAAWIFAKARLPGHKVLARAPAQLGRGDAAIDGERIDAQYKNGAQIVRQRQAAFAIAANRALILTASSPRPFDAAFEALWSGWLASFDQPAAAGQDAGDAS